MFFKDIHNYISCNTKSIPCKVFVVCTQIQKKSWVKNTRHLCFPFIQLGGYCNIKDLSFSNKHQKKATVEAMIALKDTKVTVEMKINAKDTASAMS